MEVMRSSMIWCMVVPPTVVEPPCYAASRTPLGVAFRKEKGPCYGAFSFQLGGIVRVVSASNIRIIINRSASPSWR